MSGDRAVGLATRGISGYRAPPLVARGISSHRAPRSAPRMRTVLVTRDVQYLRWKSGRTGDTAYWVNEETARKNRSQKIQQYG